MFKNLNTNLCTLFSELPKIVAMVEKQRKKDAEEAPNSEEGEEEIEGEGVGSEEIEGFKDIQ
jgi:hypothetical protein